MKDTKAVDIFGATNSLKVLSYLAHHPGEEIEKVFMQEVERGIVLWEGKD